MMESLRKGASGIVVKAFLAVLVASFVVWGVADVFRGYGSRAVATVAGREIQPEQFQQAFEQEFQRVQSQSGQSITREMARKFGLDQQVLGRLIQESVLDAHARDLKLSLTDQAVLDTDQAGSGIPRGRRRIQQGYVCKSSAGQWADGAWVLR